MIFFPSQYQLFYSYSSSISSLLKHTFEIQINKHFFYLIIKEVKCEKRRLWPWPILIPKCNVILKNTHDIKMLFSDKNILKCLKGTRYQKWCYMYPYLFFLPIIRTWSHFVVVKSNMTFRTWVGVTSFSKSIISI